MADVDQVTRSVVDSVTARLPGLGSGDEKDLHGLVVVIRELVDGRAGALDLPGGQELPTQGRMRRGRRVADQPDAHRPAAPRQAAELLPLVLDRTRWAAGPPPLRLRSRPGVTGRSARHPDADPGGRRPAAGRRPPRPLSRRRSPHPRAVAPVRAPPVAGSRPAPPPAAAAVPAPAPAPAPHQPQPGCLVGLGAAAARRSEDQQRHAARRTTSAPPERSEPRRRR